jgi:hypothetical protein
MTKDGGQPGNWPFGIRGKPDKNFIRAFVWNKRSHHWPVNPPESGEAGVQGWYEMMVAD